MVLGFLVFFSATFAAFVDEASTVKANNKIQILFKKTIMKELSVFIFLQG